MVAAAPASGCVAGRNYLGRWESLDLMLKARWLRLWGTLRGSLWLLPGVFTLAALALAEVAVRLDEIWTGPMKKAPLFIYTGNAAGAREVLSTLAAGMISLTTISFSVMVVVLTLAANQFGPRVLRSFLADRLNQAALGTFVATFVYCVTVLGRVPDAEEFGQVPRLAVMLALLLTLASLAMLIVFVHHVARSIQAAQVIQSAFEIACAAIDRVYPERIGNDHGEEPVNWPESPPRLLVRATQSGYLQSVDPAALLEFAGEHDAMIKLRVKPGDFINHGDELAWVWASGLPDDAEGQVRAWFEQATERSPEQDAVYALRQLGEIAIRALSPGINDPYTAVEAIDYLGAALRHLASRRLPPEARHDEHGALRAWLPRDDFGAIAGATMNPVRHYARSHAPVVARIIHLLNGLAPHLQREDDRAWRREQCQALLQQLDAVSEETQRRTLAQACTRAIAAG